MEILGLIPARGGSKSIPHKNIYKLAGKPLLFYTCEAALASKLLTRVILNTDSERIARVGKQYGIETPFMRPKALAQDKTLVIDVIFHALEYLKKTEKYSPDIIVLLQPTSPLRKASHIDAVIRLLQKTKADSVVTVTEVPHQFNPVSVMAIKNGRLTPFMTGKQILRRQDKPKVYGRNGPAVLAFWTKTLTRKRSLYGDDIRPFLMQPEESVDIDDYYDLKIAECLIKSRKG